MKICLKGGRVVDPAQLLDGQYDLLIEDGRVAAIAPQIAADSARIIDLTGRVVLPGFIDLHVHLREPGFEGKETIASGTAAAAAGGITAVAAMPNTEPPIDTPAMVRFVEEKAAQAGFCRVYPVGTLSRRRGGGEPAELDSLYRAGVRAFSDDGSPVADSRLFRKILRQLAPCPGVVVIAHSEELSLSAGGLLHEGAVSKKLGLPAVPAVAETVAVARDILLAATAGVRLHLAHLSTAGSVELLAWAKGRGFPVTAEVTPHHLFLTDEEILRSGAQAKVNPPLRTAEDCRVLIEALRTGLIDIIATDHAPHQAAEKAAGLETAPCGIAGLETAVPLLLTGLVNRGKLALADLVRAFSCRPAELLGLKGGTLRPGSPADLTVLDLEAAGTIDPKKFYSLARQTPFAGWPYRGRPVMTIVGGRIIMEQGVVHGIKR